LCLEGQEQTDRAATDWRRAERCWLRLLADDERSVTSAHPLLVHLLGLHRRRVGELLAQGNVEAARRHWAAVRGLADEARLIGDPLAGAVGEAVKRCREEMTSEQLADANEAARYGDIPEGFRQDHEQRLARLGRLLSLEANSVPVLTALVEACNE